MANKRIIVKRRKSVRNVRKITRTMQLIATARFQAAMSRATATKPYTEKLAELVADITAAGQQVEHPLMRPREGASRSAMVVITANRGLCGGYNANVLRTAIKHLDQQAAAGTDTDVHMVGKKGVNYFRFLHRPTVEQLMHIGDKPRFEEIEPVANSLMERFVKGEISSAYVSYMRFYTIGKQRPEVLRLLPLSGGTDDRKDAAQASRQVQFEYSPEPSALMDELLPATVRAQVFQCFTDAAVSEQLARMVAMKAATDAAGDMITTLSRQYNRARQTQITMELLDIVGGANALA